MLITLRDLAAEEDRVARLIATAPADLEARDRALARSGVYRYYEAIFGAYRALADSSRASEPVQAEALRRAVFLAWYACVAPPQLSGLAEFSDDQLEDAFRSAAWALENGELDPELAWMLAWYFREAPVVFTRLPGLARLVAYCRAQPPEGWRTAGLTPERLGRRGALGRYWLGVLARDG